MLWPCWGLLPGMAPDTAASHPSTATVPSEGVRVPPPSCISKFVLSPHCISCVLCPQGESGEPGPKGQVSEWGFGREGLPAPLRWGALQDPQPEVILTTAAALHGAALWPLDEVFSLEMGFSDHTQPWIQVQTPFAVQNPPAAVGTGSPQGLGAQPPCAQDGAELPDPDAALHPHRSKASRASSASPAPQGTQAHPACEATRDPPARGDSSGSAACRGCPASGA